MASLLTTSKTNTSTSTTKLIARVQALPSELFLDIRDLTFTADEASEITLHYKLPAIFYVDRRTQQRLLANTTFHSDSRYYIDTWLWRLSSAQIAQLREVRFDFRWDPPASTAILGDDGKYPVMSEATKIEMQTEQAKERLRSIRSDVERHRRKIDHKFLTAQAWEMVAGSAKRRAGVKC